MTHISPTAEGFRAAWRRPSFTLAEIVWRWSAGATALALFLFGFREYLSTLPVSAADLLFLRSGQPALIGQAVAHILRGSLQRVVFSSALAAVALSALWIVAASLGRMATLRAVIEYFRTKFSNYDEHDATRGSFSGLLGLNFLRAAVGLAALVGAIFGTSVVIGRVSTQAAPHPGWAFFSFCVIAMAVMTAWFFLNWILSLASLFVVRDSADSLQALALAVALSRDRFGAVFAVSAWFGLAHFVVLSMAWSAMAFPLQFAPVLPGRALLVMLALISLIYFAVADWLYMGRLAGYACVAEIPATPAGGSVPPAPWQPPSAIANTIDEDELILSDASVI